MHMLAYLLPRFIVVRVQIVLQHWCLAQPENGTTLLTQIFDLLCSACDMIHGVH
jgi:hypothetical protein